MSRTLYQLEGCPYCEKVADRLDELVEWDKIDGSWLYEEH